MWINAGKIKTSAIDLLFPKNCALCKKEGSFLCSPCFSALIPLAPSCFICKQRNLDGKTCRYCCKKTPIRRFWAPFLYKNQEIRDLIHIYKYNRARDIGPVLAGFLIKTLRQNGFSPPKNFVIMPIPLHKERLRQRGFNQAELIAYFIGKEFNLPVETNILKRVKNTAAQIELENDAIRKENVAGVFSVNNRHDLPKKIILLVDDVVTSGATMSEAARVLKNADAKSVWACSIARRN